MMHPEGKPDRDPELSHNSAGRYPAEQDEPPSVPGCATWRTVYCIVFAVFILYIVLMRAFEGLFS